MTHKKGFTLVELLIVIGILAILATATVLVINPAELLAQARDTSRISDLAGVVSAATYYLSTAAAIDLDEVGTCGTTWSASTSALAASNQPFATPAVQIASRTIAAADIGKVDGNGWVTIDLTDAEGGAPLSALPRDPSPAAGSLVAAGRFYAYQCNTANKTFELNANMESTKYSAGGTGNVEGTDGGTSACDAADSCTAANADLVYEVGTDPGLDL